MEQLVATHRTQLISSMPMVKRYMADLKSLNDWWEKIALIGKINSLSVASTILTDMDGTKKKFVALQHKLIENLILENVNKRIVDDSSRAQVAIDILIRNLFERTADVGFLATDDDIRDFLLKDSANNDDREFICQRLNEYVKKYSVYDEIVVFSITGQVMAHLDEKNPISFCSDPLIAKTLKSDSEYVETFRHSDIQPNIRRSLIYSAKITRSNNAPSDVIGILCLCFRFDNEMEGIFKNLLSKVKDTVLMITDKNNRVIASSDEALTHVGRACKNNNMPGIVNYGGKVYLANTLKTNGYQGFFGLGWSGQVWSPLEKKFTHNNANDRAKLDSGLIERAQMFSAELKEIRRTSTIINDDLSLVVLNGKITAARKDAKEFMPVLEAIKQIGADTANIFSASINNLQTTVINAHLDDATFMSALAVDIMDRNLYERANDCRWWALTSVFRRLLNKTSLCDDDEEEITSILQYINSLYTVYTNLYVYDRSGRILAVSNEKEKGIIGTIADERSGATAALQVNDSQKYAVSPFRRTDLYNDRHTYIYNASITNIDNPYEVVGGIGIVFDSEPQFSAMLHDVLPKDETGQMHNDSFGLFVDRSGKIIAVASNAEIELKVGDTFEFHNAEIGKLECGTSLSRVFQVNGKDYAVGASVSQGYREYKTTGDYENDVLAMIFVPF